jgi:hypothetical protein
MAVLLGWGVNRFSCVDPRGKTVFHAGAQSTRTAMLKNRDRPVSDMMIAMMRDGVR